MGFGQEMDGCGRCMKYALFAINFLIFIGGAIVLIIGLWMLIDRTYINMLLGTNLYIGSVYVLIATGALTAFISFFGCMGAAKEVKCLLLTYNILVLIILVIMLVGGILGFVFREKIRTSMEHEMSYALGKYGDRDEYTQAWDYTQEQLMCCGITYYTDWRDYIPPSCCKEVEKGGRKLPCGQVQTDTTIYMDGCLEKGIEFMRENGIILGASAIIVALTMVFAIIFSCIMFMKIE